MKKISIEAPVNYCEENFGWLKRKTPWVKIQLRHEEIVAFFPFYGLQISAISCRFVVKIKSGLQSLKLAPMCLEKKMLQIQRQFIVLFFQFLQTF